MVNPLVSGVGDAVGSMEPTASTSYSPVSDVSSNENSMDGLRVSRHSEKDNKDLLFCYVWAKYMARQSYSGYMKHLEEKWKVVRGDKPMSKTALATKWYIWLKII